MFLIQQQEEQGMGGQGEEIDPLTGLPAEDEFPGIVTEGEGVAPGMGTGDPAEMGDPMGEELPLEEDPNPTPEEQEEAAMRAALDEEEQAHRGLGPVGAGQGMPFSPGQMGEKFRVPDPPRPANKKETAARRPPPPRQPPAGVMKSLEAANAEQSTQLNELTKTLSAISETLGGHH